MKPYRIELDFVVAEENLEAANRLHDSLLDYGEFKGLIYEGGFIGEMPLQDVIKGSPL